jgi:hypothetical protein
VTATMRWNRRSLRKGQCACCAHSDVAGRSLADPLLDRGVSGPEGCFSPIIKPSAKHYGVYAFCAQARSHNDRDWTYLNPIKLSWLFESRELKPWTLNGELFEETKPPLDQLHIDIVPATHSYLESIGLSRQFQHMVRRSVMGVGTVEEDVWAVDAFSLRGLF